MIEPYNINNMEIGFSIENIAEKIFFFLIILLTLWMFISLTVWLVGAKIKSEKVIKYGVSSFVLSIVMMIITLLIPLLISFTK